MTTTIGRQIGKCGFTGCRNKGTHVVVQSELFGISIISCCEDHYDYFLKVHRSRW